MSRAYEAAGLSSLIYGPASVFAEGGETEPYLCASSGLQFGLKLGVLPFAKLFWEGLKGVKPLYVVHDSECFQAVGQVMCSAIQPSLVPR